MKRDNSYFVQTIYYNLIFIYYPTFRGSPHYADFENLYVYVLNFVVHLFPTLHVFLFLEKITLCKIRISGTVIMTQHENLPLTCKNAKNHINGNLVLWGRRVLQNM